ncbi:Tar ligand binding domain-containing protein [Bradyrhizobium diazoefficiens]|nr:Tar ligand binding domain-containing protein [Bradyrhizobium diazoefficiens]
MKMNLPVVDVEYPIGDDAIIVSKTDAKGRISYVNDDFVEASGFTTEELLNKPHNIVRHPDMPEEGFADLWVTLKSGKPWTGAVKNRRKNGEYYWVLATASPIWDNGEITGYMSVRTRLPSELRCEAETVYAQIRERKPCKYRLDAGMLHRRSFSDRFTVFTGTLKARLTMLVASLMIFTLVTGVIGIFAAEEADSHLRKVYSDRTVPLSELFVINDRMQANVLNLYGAAANGLAGKPLSGVEAGVNKNAALINQNWERYMATYLTTEEKGIADSYTQKRRDFLDSGLKPGLALLSAGRFEDLSRHLTEKVQPLFEAAKQDAERLVALQVDVANAEYEEAQRNFAISTVVTVGTLFVAFVLGALLGLLTIRAVSRPAAQLVDLMAKIAKGSFNNRVMVERDDEIGIAFAIFRRCKPGSALTGKYRNRKRDTDWHALRG